MKAVTVIPRQRVMVLVGEGRRPSGAPVYQVFR